MSTGVSFGNEFGRRVDIHIEQRQVELAGEYCSGLFISIAGPDSTATLCLTMEEAQRLCWLLGVEVKKTETV